jgi:translation initiation factor IF-2
MGGGGRPTPGVAPPPERRGGSVLPPVAPGSSGPGVRRDGPRPSGSEGGGKTQRPDAKFTPAQLREMMQSGKMGPGGGPGTQAPGGRPGAPGQRPFPGNRPGGPPVGPGGPGGPPAEAPAAFAPPGELEDEERKSKASRLGSAADRASRRAKREQRANERTRVTSPVDARSILEGGDDDVRKSKGPRRQKGGRGALIAPRKSQAEIEPPITIRNLSETIGVKANDLIRKLMSLGHLVTINSTLDEETAVMLSLEFGIELVVREDDIETQFGPDDTDDVDEAALRQRPPVITILGHVDHGKTSLLDKIRKANVVASESGGITQHIGAYQIEHQGKRITFVDTPGHEAFTAMRARGANVTDIVVLVVAADDGVMPQTREAIAHARAAEVPVVVALNKIDLPNADSQSNLSRIYGELAQEGLNPAEWGGETEVIKTSTVTGQGLTDLLGTLEIVAELKDMKANPDRPATGTCLESSLSEGRGVTATVLVQEGTLRVGDSIVCGDGYGKVRALYDDLGRSIEEAPPSTPVEVSGLDQVPVAGEKFAVVTDVSVAREIAESRRTRTRGANLGERPTITLENLFSRVSEQKVKTLNLILKADVQGSLEALVKELEKLENPEVPVRVLLKAVGGITESDVLLADASQAIIVGFRVAPEDRAVTLAEEKKIDIRRYDIIYQVTDEVKKSIEGMLVPEVKETHQGRAVVRQTFKISRVGTVAGCVVTQGVIERGAKVRLIRDGREIYKGALEAVKRFKDDVKEVREGYECGLKIANFDDVKTDDVIEAYKVEVIRRTL